MATSSDAAGKTADKDGPLEGTLPLRLTSVVVRGFGRGSNDLGIPTANLSREKIQFNLQNASFDDLPTGIYWGFCRIGEDSTIFKTACSIGYNPTYGNKLKTVEPHLIASPGDKRRHQSCCGETVLGDFYDQTIRLSLVEYMRPELPFEGLEKLVAAIKKDISDAELLGDRTDTMVLKEKEWVMSDIDPNEC